MNLTKEETRWLDIGKAVERACEHLPEGAYLSIELERGAGTVVLHMPEDDGPGLHEWQSDTFGGQIDAAIDFAIKDE